MNAEWLLSWWNLIYVLPFGLALLYLAIYMVSGISFGEADADVDADVDADLDADADIDAHVDVDADLDADADVDADMDGDVDHDMDTEQDVEADHDADAEHDADGAGSPSTSLSAIWAAMSFLGVGKVPVSMVLMVLLLTWGGVGFAANQMARDYVAEPWQVTVVSLPLAALVSLLLTGGTSRAINRFMPLNMTSARRRHELLGSVGEVILPIDAIFGMANVRDENGNLFQVPCRIDQSAGAGATTLSIPKGARVKLVAYSARELLFYVRPEAQPV